MSREREEESDGWRERKGNSRLRTAENGLDEGGRCIGGSNLLHIF